MALTERQKETVLDSLRGRIKGGCPMCASTEWTLHDEVVSTMTSSLGGDAAIGGRHIPMVQLVCNKWGFVGHHAIGLLGISLNE